MAAMLELDQEACADAEWAASAAVEVAAFRAAFPSLDRAARIAFVMRIGWGAAQAIRASRRPLEQSVDER